MAKITRTTLFLTGGLGNQLFQYAAAISRGSNELFIDSTLGNPKLNESGVPDLFDFKLPVTTNQHQRKLPCYLFSKTAGFLLRHGMQPRGFENNPVVGNIIHCIGTGVLAFWLGKITKLRVATDNGYWQMPVLKRREYLIGYFQSFIWASEPGIAKQLKRIQLERPPVELLDFLESESQIDAVAIHVRLGDYKSEDSFGIPNKSYYGEALQKLGGSQHIKRIWLFSNEPEEAVGYIPLEYMDRLKIVPDFRGNAAATLEAMRHAKNYVIANSSLSWWGAFLSYSPSPKVIAPTPWFKSSREPSEIVPPSWIRQTAWHESLSE